MRAVLLIALVAILLLAAWVLLNILEVAAWTLLILVAVGGLLGLLLWRAARPRRTS